MKPFMPKIFLQCRCLLTKHMGINEDKNKVQTAVQTVACCHLATQ